MADKLSLKERMLPAPRNGGFKMEGYWVWCGSCIKGEDNRYHLFASRWPNTLPMHPGWMFASEVVRASSDTPCGPYKFEEVILPARGPQYWDGRATHNPMITKQGDTYVLFYIGITNPFADPIPNEPLLPSDLRVQMARTTKRIGIATSKSVFGPWERRDEPVLQTRPEHFDSLLTSNPAPCYNDDGSVLLIYKARAYKAPPYVGQLHGDMTFGAATAKTYDGVYTRLCEQPIFTPGEQDLEDPFIWKTQNGYEMIAKDMNGSVCGERHGGVHAFSTDGMHWDLKKGELAYSRNVLWDDGSTQLMGSMERPFLLFENGIATHAFFATSDGVEGFGDAAKTWNMVIPLKCEE